MLGKLLKYDLKTELRSLLPCYAITLGLSLLVRMMSVLIESFPLLKSVYGFLMVFCVIALFAVVIWTMITSIRHFYMNVLKDQGYLTNTLPVSRNQIILAKEITGTITMLLATIFVIFGALIAFYHGGVKDIFDILMNLSEIQGVSAKGMIAWLVVMMALNYISQLMMIFTSMMLGQTRNTNKVMYSVVFAIILSIVLQVVSFLAIGIDFIIQPSVMEVMQASSQSFVDVYAYIQLLFTTTLILTLIVMVVLHVMSVYLANHKLNLE